MSYSSIDVSMMADMILLALPSLADGYVSLSDARVDPTTVAVHD
jgi:hypothetical protein